MFFWITTITSIHSKPLSKRIDAIISYQKLETFKNVRCFLRMINFCKRFLKNAASLCKYLKRATKNDKCPIDCNPESKAAFETAKML